MAKIKKGKTPQEGVEIYVLKHPVTGEVRYAGKANNTQKRLATHVRDSNRRNTPVYCWFRKLAKEGLVPLAEVVEVCSGPWQESEIRVIAQYKGTGRLLNVALGGDEPFCSKRQRAKNGRAVAATIHNDPLQKKIWRLKKDMGDSLRFFKAHGMVDVYNKNVRRLKEYAAKCPELFSKWASLSEMDHG